MRELKFRVWDEKEKTMLYTDMDDLCDPRASDFRIFVDDQPIFRDIPIMQYTGLKDKNGKEVYEGDIVRCKTDDYQFGEIKIGKIRWGTYAMAFELCKGEMTIAKMRGGFTPQIKELPNGGIDGEVIGNIYENRELI